MSTSISLKAPLTVTLAAAPEPPPPVISITGGFAASYPSPAEPISTDVIPPNLILVSDLYDHADTPFTQAPIGPNDVSSRFDTVSMIRGIRTSLRWFPGNSADPTNGPTS